MGKSSKRREGKETVKQPRARLNPCLVQPLVPKPTLPPATPLWFSYPEALRALEQDGWSQAKYAPGYTSTELCMRIASFLDGRGVQVSDCTNYIPEGPQASHAEYPLALTNLEQVSEVCPNKLFVMMRTRANTPAFLGGTTYVYTLEMGSKEKAVEFTRKMTTPVLIAFYNGVNMVLPTVAAQGTACLPAKIIAAMVDDENTRFECAVCQESFLVKHEEQQFELKSFLATDCDHAFHAECILRQLHNGITTCATCRTPLPYDWVVPGHAPRPRADDPFRPPTTAIGEVEGALDGLVIS